jgi:hypothetical protein
MCHLEQAVADFHRLGDDWHHALALECPGHAQHDPEAAMEQLQRSADLFGRLPDQVKRANCLNEMARRSIDVRAHLDEVPAWLTEARILADRTGNETERLHAEMLQARLDQCWGEQALAGQRFRWLLAEFRRVAARCR